MKGTARIAAGAACIAVVGIAYARLRPHETPRPQPPHQNSVSQPSAPSTPAPVEVKPLPEKTPSLTLLGTVMAGAQAALSVRQPARIASVLVREGESVKRGQLLVVLDSGETQAGRQSALAGVSAARAQADKARAGRKAQEVKADADIATAQAGVTQAREKLRQAQLGVAAAQAADQADLGNAQAGVRKAETGLQTAQTALRSLEGLSEVGGVSRNDLEGARVQVKAAQADLETAQAAVRRVQAGPQSNALGANGANNASSGTNTANVVRSANGNAGVTFRVANAQQDAAQAQTGVTQALVGVDAAHKAKTQVLAVAEADVQAALAAVAQAQAGLNGAQVGQQAACLTSPLDGIVSNLTARTGETAQPGSPLLSVVSSAGARIEALVPARQLSLLRVGQPARVAVDTRPDTPINAIVSAISSIAEPDGRTFRVTLRLNQTNNSSSSLRVGQNARIQIEFHR